MVQLNPGRVGGGCKRNCREEGCRWWEVDSAWFRSSALRLALSPCPLTAGAGEAPRPLVRVRGRAGPGPPPASPAEGLPGRLGGTILRVPGDGGGLVLGLTQGGQGGGGRPLSAQRPLGRQSRSSQASWQPERPSLFPEPPRVGTPGAGRCCESRRDTFCLPPKRAVPGALLREEATKKTQRKPRESLMQVC